MSQSVKVLRWMVFVPVILILGPVVAFGVLVMVTAGIGLLFNANLNPFDVSDIGPLDWLFGGPGASAGDWIFFLKFLGGAAIAWLGVGLVIVAWEWARASPRASAQESGEPEGEDWWTLARSIPRVSSDPLVENVPEVGTVAPPTLPPAFVAEPLSGLGILPQGQRAMASNWSRRFKNNIDKLRSGDTYQVAEVVRDLSIRDREEGLSAGEKRMLDKARWILASELGVTEEKAQEMVDEVLSDPHDSPGDEGGEEGGPEGAAGDRVPVKPKPPVGGMSGELQEPKD